MPADIQQGDILCSSPLLILLSTLEDLRVHLTNAAFKALRPPAQILVKYHWQKAFYRLYEVKGLVPRVGLGYPLAESAQEQYYKLVRICGTISTTDLSWCLEGFRLHKLQINFGG